MQRWRAHRLASGSALARKRGSAALRLLTAVALTPVLGMTVLTVSASAASMGP
jgi:hypothetical protein